MNPMDELIASTEFGDWLVNECELETERMESSNASLRNAAFRRLGALEQAKQLLLEFLTLQQDMMQFAALDKSLQDQDPGGGPAVELG